MGGSAKTDFVCYKGPKSADDGGRVGQKIKKIADVSCVRPLTRIVALHCGGRTNYSNTASSSSSLELLYSVFVRGIRCAPVYYGGEGGRVETDVS